MTTKSVFYFLSIKHCVLPSTFSQPCWQVGMGVVEADGESSPLSCFVSSSYKTSFPSPFIIIGQYQMSEYGKNIIKEGFGLVQSIGPGRQKKQMPGQSWADLVAMCWGAVWSSAICQVGQVRPCHGALNQFWFDFKQICAGPEIGRQRLKKRGLDKSGVWRPSGLSCKCFCGIISGSGCHRRVADMRCSWMQITQMHTEHWTLNTLNSAHCKGSTDNLHTATCTKHIVFWTHKR